MGRLNLPPHARLIKRTIEEAGFKVVETKFSRHIQFRAEPSFTYTSPYSPSDRRGLLNARAAIKRAAMDAGVWPGNNG